MSSKALFTFMLQFVKTILSQAHLAPLPLYVSPVYWAYDYSLRVYPVPDLLLIADKYDPFTVTNTDCLCINPVRVPHAGQNKKGVQSDPSAPLTISRVLLLTQVRYICFSLQGSFPRSGFSFKVFYPSNKTVEDR